MRKSENYKKTYLEIFNKEREKGTSIEDAKKIAEEIAHDLEGGATEKEINNNSKETGQQFPDIQGKDRAFLFGVSPGAFFGAFWWAIASKLPMRYIIGYLIPIVNIFVWLTVFINGRQISWREGNWDSFEEFKEKQKKFDPFFVVLFLLIFWFILVMAIGG